MAVAIGSQSGCLTPIGHQSDTSILSPSGLRFCDFRRLGLPLQAVALVVAILSVRSLDARRRLSSE